MPIHLILADDHPLVLDGLTQLFATEPDFEIVARCNDGAQTIQALHEHHADILVLDLRMPHADGLTVLRQLMAEKLPTRVVVLTAAVDEEEVLEAIRLGVRGVVLKEMAPQILIQCLRTVYAGGQWLERQAVTRAIDKLLQREANLQEITSILTAREVELVKLVATGLSNRGIGEALDITEGTVKVHMHRIYDKLKVKSRVALTLLAQEKGLV